MRSMLKYLVGQEFQTNRTTEFPEGYEPLKKGATFQIQIAKEVTEWGPLEYPYLVRFENGFEIAMDEKGIEELTCEKEEEISEKTTFEKIEESGETHKQEDRMDRENLMQIDYNKTIGGIYEVEMVALYNQSRISQEEVKEAIQTETDHPFIIFSTKQQFENVFIKQKFIKS